MKQYLKKLTDRNAYTAFLGSSDYITPNVSLCATENEMYYNPYVETRVVVKYNITDTSNPTALRTNYENNIFKSMEIDGVMIDELVTGYTFSTTGEHTVKYELYDETKLGNNAPVFYNSNLIECVIPDSVTIICDNAFNNCTSLTSVTIGNGVTSIGSGAFQDCYSLTSIDIPDGITSIGEYTFRGCSSLTSITIPDSVTSIGNNAFKYCRGISSIDIPDSVTSIGDNAFRDCSGLTSIDIPDSVTSIGDYAFNNCTNLPIENNLRYADTYLVEAIDKTLSTYVLKNNTRFIGNSAFQNCRSLTSIDIPDSVTSIGNSAFYYCSSLTSIDIPNSVTSIGNSAFYYCSGLTSCTIGSGVTSIGNYAFRCSSLTSCIIGNGVTSIGDNAFSDCSGLTSIDIPSGVTSIGSNAFSNCRSFTSIVCNAITAPTIQNNTFYNIKTGGTLRVPSGSSGYDVWMGTGDYYLGKYNWTKVEQ